MVRRFTLDLKNAGIVGSMQDYIYKYSSMFCINPSLIPDNYFQ